jgi:hypothetical protein
MYNFASDNVFLCTVSVIVRRTVIPLSCKMTTKHDHDSVQAVTCDLYFVTKLHLVAEVFTYVAYVQYVRVRNMSFGPKCTHIDIRTKKSCLIQKPSYESKTMTVPIFIQLQVNM